MVQPTKVQLHCQEDGLPTEAGGRRNRRLAPDHTFLVKKVVDHFDAFAHLSLGLFRHRQDCPDNLARFHIIQ